MSNNYGYQKVILYLFKYRYYFNILDFEPRGGRLMAYLYFLIVELADNGGGRLIASITSRKFIEIDVDLSVSNRLKY